jgi:hypothetical protein
LARTAALVGDEWRHARFDVDVMASETGPVLLEAFGMPRVLVPRLGLYMYDRPEWKSMTI